MQFPVLCGRTLVCLYFICRLVYLLVQIPRVSLPSFPPGSHRFVSYVCKSICVLQIRSLVSCFRLYIEVMS